MLSKNHTVSNMCGLCATTTLIGLTVQMTQKTKYISQDVQLKIIHLFKDFINWIIEVPFIPSLYLSLFLMFLFYLVGTYLPDIDHANSRLGRYFYVPVEHRGILHSIYPVIMFLIMGFAFRPFFWLAFGYYGHLFFDNYSVMGVCFIKPLTGYIKYKSGAKIKKGHKLKFYKVGSQSENLFVIIILLITFIIVFIGWQFDIYNFYKFIYTI